MVASGGVGDEKSILIVDDDVLLGKTLSRIFQREGYQTTVATSANEAFHTIGKIPLDLILLDLSMPHFSGMRMLPLIRPICPDTPIVIYSAFVDEQLVDSLNHYQIAGVWSKPMEPQEILTRTHEIFCDK
jgi:CheY-like chemotaxis protein